MGTRNLTCVYHKGEYKVAQYGQWDGYPDGQGATILGFLSEEMNRKKFLDRLEFVRFGTQEECNAAWENESKKVFLTRDTGGEILALIQDSSGVIVLGNAISFAVDSLMCEWAYVVDFDTNRLEVYKGFNETPLADGDRFYNDGEKHEYSIGTDYYPVKMVVSFDLDNLPSEIDFVNQAAPQDVDD